MKAMVVCFVLMEMEIKYIFEAYRNSLRCNLIVHMCVPATHTHTHIHTRTHANQNFYARVFPIILYVPLRRSILLLNCYVDLGTIIIVSIVVVMNANTKLLQTKVP